MVHGGCDGGVSGRAGVKSGSVIGCELHSVRLQLDSTAGTHSRHAYTQSRGRRGTVMGQEPGRRGAGGGPRGGDGLS